MNGTVLEAVPLEKLLREDLAFHSAADRDPGVRPTGGRACHRRYSAVNSAMSV